MPVTRRDSLHHTYGEYLTWPEGNYAELVNGTAYVRDPPAPSRFHQELVGEIYLQVRVALQGRAFGIYVAPFDVRLPRDGESDELIDTVVQPDVLVVGDLGKLDDRGMRGAPDWVAEVLSPATASHDKVTKLAVYERAGVREVWIVDPIERMLGIYRLQDGRYRQPTIIELNGRTTIHALPGVIIDWDRLPAWSS